jgi:transposase
LAEKHGFLEVKKPLPSVTEIAKALGPVKWPEQCTSTVEPYKEVVEEYLSRGVAKTVIWRKLREDHGYTGSYSSVKRYCRRLEPSAPQGYCRVETAPGQQAQVDFGYVGRCGDEKGKLRKVWAFVMTLSWSRHLYVEFVFDQRMSTWLRCHEDAFRWFGGVPQRIVIDNLKAAVLKRELQDPVLSIPYRRLARHYGFIVSANRPRTPRHKGKVESAVKYVKGNFIAGEDLESLDLARLNRRGRKWVLQVAGVRDHGTTHERPLTRYHSVERSALQRLPDQPFELVKAYRATLHHDCHVVVDGRYYSAPYTLIGKKLDVYVGVRVVEIYHETALVATHLLVEKKGGRATRLSHYPSHKREWLEKTPERCRQLAIKIGPWCGKAVAELLSDRVQDRLPSVHSLLRLKEKVGKDRLEAACKRAVHYGDPRYIRVKTILAVGMENKPLDQERTIPQQHESYRYARASSSYFPQEVS